MLNAEFRKSTVNYQKTAILSNNFIKTKCFDETVVPDICSAKNRKKSVEFLKFIFEMFFDSTTITIKKLS